MSRMLLRSSIYVRRRLKMARNLRASLRLFTPSWALQASVITIALLLFALLIINNVHIVNRFNKYSSSSSGSLGRKNSSTKIDVAKPKVGGGIKKVDTKQQSSSSISFQRQKAAKRRQDVVYQETLKKLGLERVEAHSFKSPYIVNPAPYHILNETDIVKAPGVRQTKIISLHQIRYHPWFWSFNTVNRDFKRCPYSECEVDLHGTQEDKAAVIIFLCKRQAEPPPRQPGQLWALFCWEAEPHWEYPPNYDKVWKHGVNIMMGYRLGSEHFTPYLKLAWRDSSLLPTTDKYLEIAKLKTKTATMFMSNCRPDRLNFVTRMQRYIDIDIWGACGPLDCPRDNPKVCMDALNTTYKFYLAFENTFCADYASVKFYRPFVNHAHIIPVGKGGFHYDRYVPPGLFVNGNKFNTAKELALYLKDLGNDLPRYAKMLQEKDRLVALPEEHADWCLMCEQAHTGSFPPRHGVRTWTHGNTCRPSEY